MLESATLAIAGGAIAIVLARWAGPALWRLVLPAGTELASSHSRIVAATAAIAIAAALAMTILPALFQRTTRVGDALRGGARGTSRRTSAVGELLVALQVSLTVVLLVGAGLFVRSLLRVQALDLGFAAQHVVGVRVNTGRAGRDSAAAAAIIARARDALSAARTHAEAQGFQVTDLGDQLQAEARYLGASHAALARRLSKDGRRRMIISGGETTVTVVNKAGRGGRNLEYLLGLAIALDGEPGIHALACDTDGIDGSEDNAGAVLSPDSLTRAKSKNLRADKLLDNNDGYAFFSALDALVMTGPTRTNVNDYRVILVL